MMQNIKNNNNKRNLDSCVETAEPSPGDEGDDCVNSSVPNRNNAKKIKTNDEESTCGSVQLSHQSNQSTIVSDQTTENVDEQTSEDEIPDTYDDSLVKKEIPSLVVNGDLQRNRESLSARSSSLIKESIDYESNDELNGETSPPPLLPIPNGKPKFLAALLGSNSVPNHHPYADQNTNENISMLTNRSVGSVPIPSTSNSNGGGEGGGSSNSKSTITTTKSNVYQGLYPIAEVKQYFEKESVDGKTLYICKWPNCDFKTVKYSQHISRHIHLKHIGIKELRCEENKCGKVFKRPESLVQHQKNHICGFGIDNERIKDPTNRCGVANINKNFKRVLDNDIHVYKCQIEGCNFVTNNSGSIRRHVHNQHICPYSASATNGTGNGATSSANHGTSNNHGSDVESESEDNNPNINSSISVHVNHSNSYDNMQQQFELINAIRECQSGTPDQSSLNNQSLIQTIRQQLQNNETNSPPNPYLNPNGYHLYYLLQQAQQQQGEQQTLDNSAPMLEYRQHFQQQFQNHQQGHPLIGSSHNDNDSFNGDDNRSQEEGGYAGCNNDEDEGNDDDDDDEYQQRLILRPEVEFTEYNDQLYDPVNKSSRPNGLMQAEEESAKKEIKTEVNDEEDEDLPIDLTRPGCSGLNNGQHLNDIGNNGDSDDDDNDDDDDKDTNKVALKLMLNEYFKTQLQNANNNEQNQTTSQNDQAVQPNHKPKTKSSQGRQSSRAASKAAVGSSQQNGSKSNGMYSLKNYRGSYRKEKIDNKMEFICIECERKNLEEANATKSEYRFKSQISLIRHLWEESNFKDFNCEICGKTFENEFSLYKHRKFEHGQSGSSPSMPIQANSQPSNQSTPGGTNRPSKQPTRSQTPQQQSSLPTAATPPPSLAPPSMLMSSQGPLLPGSTFSQFLPQPPPTSSKPPPPPQQMPMSASMQFYSNSVPDSSNIPTNHPPAAFAEAIQRGFLENLQLNEINRQHQQQQQQQQQHPFSQNAQQQMVNQMMMSQPTNQMLKLLEMLPPSAQSSLAQNFQLQQILATLKLAISGQLNQPTEQSRTATPPSNVISSSALLNGQPGIPVSLPPVSNGDNGPINYNYFNQHPPLISNLSPTGTDSDSCNNSRRSSPFPSVNNGQTSGPSNPTGSIINQTNSAFSAQANQSNQYRHAGQSTSPGPNQPMASTSSLIPLLTTPNQLSQQSTNNQFSSNLMQHPNFPSQFSIDRTNQLMMETSSNIPISQRNILNQQMLQQHHNPYHNFNDQPASSSIGGYGSQDQQQQRPQPTSQPQNSNSGIYSLRNYTNQYEKIVDPQTGEKLYKCKLCASYTVKTTVSIVKHLRGHQQQQLQQQSNSESAPVEQQQSLPNGAWNKQRKIAPQTQQFNRQSQSTDEADNEEENDDVDEDTGANELGMPGTSRSGQRQSKSNKRRQTCGIYSLKAHPKDYVREKMSTLNQNHNSNNNNNSEFSGGNSNNNNNNGYQYRCTNCDQFITSSQASMIRHIWTHKNKKNFKCQQCDQSFTKEFSLYKHKKQTHPEQTSQTRVRNSGKHLQQQQRDRLPANQLQNLNSNLIGTSNSMMMTQSPAMLLQSPSPQAQYALNLSAQNIDFQNDSNNRGQQQQQSSNDENESDDTPINNTNNEIPENFQNQQSGMSRRALRFKQNRPIHQIQQQSEESQEATAIADYDENEDEDEIEIEEEEEDADDDEEFVNSNKLMIDEEENDEDKDSE